MHCSCNIEALSLRRLKAPIDISKGTVMKTNVGSVDRVLRIVVGLALIAASVFGLIGAWAGLA